MQETPKGNRPHIAVFGRRNVGKSSLINALTNQDLALVSEIAGTTADPVYKAMELLPLGPVVMIDTAGIDDTGSLGELRVKKTYEVIRKTDLAVVVFDQGEGIGNYETNLLSELRENEIPVIGVINKIDVITEDIQTFKKEVETNFDIETVPVSAETEAGIEDLREKIAEKAPSDYEQHHIIGDLIKTGETVVLVTPIDLAAPKGRLILPQVQTIRDVLDHDGINVITKESELNQTLNKLKDNPKMVVTDSQAFAQVDAEVPWEILMTSFSILFARYKGDLELFMEGCQKIKNLTPDDKILIAEACTHRRTADDIGTVKIPNWIRSQVGADIEFDHVAGREYPDNLKEYDLVLHCGGCMLNRKEVLSRIYEAHDTGIPVINYGMAIAQLHGILNRALEPFSEIHEMWKENIEKEAG